MAAIIPDLVSTIIPAYNRPRMLREAVDSVLAQTYRPIEIIVVDDGSTDDTPRVGEALAKEYPGVVKFLRKTNSGAGPTREAGRQLAQGEFIQYLDSDDLLRPRKFELQVRALRERPECGATYGFICVHKLGQPPGTKPYKKSGEVRDTLFPWLLADRWWNTDAPLFRRSVCDAVGPWSDLRWSQDWEMDGRVGALGTRLAHVADWVCDERHHTTGRQTDSADWTRDKTRLLNRVQFMEMMLPHAIAAGVDEFAPERQHFTRYVFATARNCAAVGLREETQRLISLGEKAAGECNEVKRGMGLFHLLRSTLGTTTAGRLMKYLERFRRGGGQFTQKESFAADQQ